MNEIFEKYKDLVLRREKLLKDARKFYIEFIKVFGELIEKEYNVKLECIKLKKTIAFCQARQNRSAPVFRSELDAYIDSAMEEYYDELESLIAVRDAEQTSVAFIDYCKIKKLYRRLAMAIHPDLHPALFAHEEIAELWDRVSLAYQNNDYSELQSLELLVADAVKRYEQTEMEVSIEDAEAKIGLLQQEIDNIIHSDPYCYNKLLRDDDAIAEVKAELRSSIEEYEEYLSELQAEAAKFKVEGYGS